MEKMEHFRKGKTIVQDPKISNSYLIYNTIYTNKAHEKDQLLGWTSNIIYSAGLYLENSNSMILEIYKNEFNLKTEIVDFFLKYRVRLKLSAIDYTFQLSDDNTVEMHFVSEHFIIIESVFKKIILVDYLTGKFSTIGLKAQNKGGKYSQLKVLFTYDEFYNHLDEKSKKNSIKQSSKNTNNQLTLDTRRTNTIPIQNNYPNSASGLNSQTKDYYKETKETNTSTLSMSGTIQDKKSIQRSTSNSPPQVQTNTDHQENMRITTKPNTDNLKRRTYIFVTNRNILYYILIDNSYTFDKTMIFKKTPINLEGEEAINQMNIIRLHKEDKYSFVIFVLTKKSLSIFPTEFSKTSLKAFLVNNNYNKSNFYRIKYKFESSDGMNCHLIAKYKGDPISDVYVATKDYLITFQIEWHNLRNIAKSLCTGSVLKDVINIGKLASGVSKATYSISSLNNSNYITEATENSGNIIVYNKNGKSLEIYYKDGEFSEKVTNYREMSLIKFVEFPKFRSLFFAMNNTFNKISFNKKLYWYSEKWSVPEYLKLLSKNPFEIPKMKDIFTLIHNKYDDNKQNVICELCGNPNSKIKCSFPLCDCYYCSEEHRASDYKSFHFFHCSLKNFFMNHRYENQMKFFNELILTLSEIIKLIFSFIEGKEGYLFYLPYVKRLTDLFQILNIKGITDCVIDQSAKAIEIDGKTLIFYQEVMFFYYNLMVLYLNFGLKGGMYLFVEKELECICNDQIFNKSVFLAKPFKKENHFYQEEVNFDNDNYNYFFLNNRYKKTLKFLKQNDIFFTDIIHLYANFIHIIDKIRKDNPLSDINLVLFDFKLKSQLLVLFEDRGSGTDIVSRYFFTYITPYICLNKKMIIAEKFLKKVESLLSSESIPCSVFNVVVYHNLGVIQYAIGKYQDGIHNLEIAYRLVVENHYSYHLRINIVEKLALAYLNVRELMKSHNLIREALYLRSMVESIDNKMMSIHLTSYLNYIKDFVEYEYKKKYQEDKEKNGQEITYRQYQRHLIDYVLGKYDSKQRSLIDVYSQDYFRATEFIYYLNKDLLNRLNNDNQSKKSTVINKEDQPQHPHEPEKPKLVNQSDYSTLSAMNPIKENTEKEEILEFENEIDIKENVFDQLTRNEQVLLTSINTHCFTRNNILRDFYGPINTFNINYHPNYTVEFKNIIESSKHHFFLKELTHSNIVELGNYFNGDENKCLDGLTRYLQQEEIQTMFKVELSKMLTSKEKENSNYILNIKTTTMENDAKKEKWINSIKESILKQKNRSIKEIDRALNELYDNLNDEYKEEIAKNPELILYYIFSDIEPNSMETTQDEVDN